MGRGVPAMHDETRTLALLIGEAAISKPALAAEIAGRSERLDHLHDLQSHFDTIRTVGSQIKASGAPQWAQQLLSNPPGVIDHLCPADWRRRWRLRSEERRGGKEGVSTCRSRWTTYT